MSIAERREAVRALVTHGLSVQRACVLVQLQRASFHYQPRSVVPDEIIRAPSNPSSAGWR